MLHFNKVSKTYKGYNGQVEALKDIDLKLEPGDFKAIQGPSGCGKSTLLMIAGGLMHPDTGSVAIAGKNLYAGNTEGLRARAIGFIFQQFHLIPYLSVLENVLVPAAAAKVENAAERAAGLLKELGLGERLDHTPATLSAGEQQRTALARALMPAPGLILADEPTGNLDPDNSAIVLEQLKKFCSNGGSVLMVTHDDLAASKADCIVQMKQGSIT